MGNFEEKSIIVSNEYFSVLDQIKEYIVNTQYKVLTVANTERNILYWKIGNVISEHSVWGNKFVETLSNDLRTEYPGTRGYSVRNLNYMRQFAQRIPSEDILHQVGAKINWKSIKALIDKTKTTDEYVWYAEQCLKNGWSSAVLVHQIESGLYKRQALAIKTTNFKERLLAPLGEQAEEIIKDIDIIGFTKRSNKISCTKESEVCNYEAQKRDGDYLVSSTDFRRYQHPYSVCCSRIYAE